MIKITVMEKEYQEIIERLDKIEKSSKKKTNVWVITTPIIVALIGFIGTRIHDINVRGETEKARILEFQHNREQQTREAESNLVLKALDDAESSAEKRENLQLLVGMNLLSSEKKKGIRKSLSNSIETADGNIIFLDETIEVYDGVVLLEESTKLSGLKRYKSASRLVEIALKQDSSNFNFYTQLAYCYSSQGRIKEAIDIYQRGFRLDVNWDQSWAYYSCAQLFAQQDDHTNAKKYAELAVQNSKLFGNSKNVKMIQDWLNTYQ